jgi:hypothetical protein
MRDNLYQYPSIKYQYVGTEEGITVVYPKFKTCSSTYDPRFRWVVLTPNFFYYEPIFFSVITGI